MAKQSLVHIVEHISFRQFDVRHPKGLTVPALLDDSSKWRVASNEYCTNAAEKRYSLLADPFEIIFR
jgi:hypothetical protein